MSRAVPDMFYLEGKLHKKIAVRTGDSTVETWCYQDETRVLYDRTDLRAKYKRAFTINAAANLINTSPGNIKKIIQKGYLRNIPESSYDLKTFAPLRMYISQDDMPELRQIVWDLLAKNKLGIPHKDMIVTEVELEHAMRLDDDREFIHQDGKVIKIFREEVR